jgi:hypothetical protein
MKFLDVLFAILTVACIILAGVHAARRSAAAKTPAAAGATKGFTSFAEFWKKWIAPVWFFPMLTLLFATAAFWAIRGTSMVVPRREYWEWKWAFWGFALFLFFVCAFSKRALAGTGALVLATVVWFLAPQFFINMGIASPLPSYSRMGYLGTKYSRVHVYETVMLYLGSGKKDENFCRQMVLGFQGDHLVFSGNLQLGMPEFHPWCEQLEEMARAVNGTSNRLVCIEGCDSQGVMNTVVHTTLAHIRVNIQSSHP